MMTDPIADFLTRVRNAVKAKHRVLEVPSSSIKKDITRILFERAISLIINLKMLNLRAKLK